jgi:hypothetical protein
VEKLWTSRAFLVDERTSEFFFPAEILCARTFVPRFACLAFARAYNRSFPTQTLLLEPVAVIHRFNQSIAGRPYLIEASFVSEDRWRAYLVRVPGVPTALMPFYGRTADEAAQQLSAWLTRAYERAAMPAGPV